MPPRTPPIPPLIGRARRWVSRWVGGCLLGIGLVPAAQADLIMNSIQVQSLIGRGQIVAGQVSYTRSSGSGPETVTVSTPALLAVVAPLPAGCALSGAAGSAQTLTCATVDPGGVGASGSFSFNVQGLSLGGGNVSAANGASIAQDSFSVVSGGDLTLSKTVAPGTTFINGQSPVFTLTPGINGDTIPAGATVTITDQLPGGAATQLFNLTSVSAPGYSCNSIANAQASGSLVCTIAGPLSSLPAISLQGRLTLAGAGGLVNNASIAPDGVKYIDNVPNNNAASVSLTVLNGADPRPTGSFPATSVTSTAQPLVINDVNDGPQSTTGSVVRVAIPTGFTIGTLPAGCVNSGAGAVNGISGTLIACTSGTVSSGSSQSFTLPLTTPATAQTGNFGIEIVTGSGGVLPDGVTDADTSNNQILVPYTIVPPYADLSVGKSKDGGPLAAGSLMNSTITVTNNGVAVAVYSAATGATPLRVIDTMRNEEQFVGVDLVQTPGWTCTDGGNDSGGTGLRRVLCLASNAGTLAVGASTTVRLQTRVANGIGGPLNLSNTACSGASALTLLGLPASAGPQPPDGNQAGGADCATASTVGTPVVAGQAQVSIAKAASRDGSTWVALPGQPTILDSDNSLYWRLTVTTPATTGAGANANQRTIPTLSLSDSLPGILNLASPGSGIPGFTTPAVQVSTAVLSGSAGGACPTTLPAGSNSLNCNFTNVAPGSTVQIVVRVNRNFDAGPLTNTAFLSSPDAILTATPGGQLNDSAAVNVASRSDPAVMSKLVNPPNSSTLRVGQTITYTIVARNLGPNQVNGPFTVTDTLDPTRLLVLSANAIGSGSSPAMGCSFVTATGAVTCATGAGTTVSRYDFYTVTIQARLIKGTLPVPANNAFVNTATVSLDPTQNCEYLSTGSGSGSCNDNAARSNNSASVSIDINNPLIDLVQKKASVLPGSQTNFGYGDTLRLRLREQNGGPSRAENIVVTDQLAVPNNYTLVFNSVAAVNAVPAESGYSLDAAKTASTVSCTQAASPANSLVICTLASGTANFLEPGTEVNFDLLFTLTGAPAVVTVTDTALVCADESNGYESAGACTFNSNGGTNNNIASVSNVVFPKTDLSLTKQRITASPVNINQPVRYDLTVQNRGANDTTQMRVADLLPPNFEWVTGGSFMPTAVTGGAAGLSVTGAPTCSASPATLTTVGQQQTVNCVLNGSFPGSTASNNTVQLTLWARPKAGFFTGPYGVNQVNTATVSPGVDGSGTATSIDIDSSNNTGTAPAQVQAASISGTVFEDRDRSTGNGGIPQAASVEPRIAGVTITLSGTDLYGYAVSRSTTTDANGNYSFTDLPPSAGYTLTETQPAGYSNGPVSPPSSGAQAPSAGSTYSAGGSVGNSSHVTGAIGGSTVAVNYNFPEVRRPSLSGYVYIDVNANGVRDAGTDLPIVGATVRLLNAATGATVASTTTVAGGAYSFTDLDPLLSYTLEEPLPTSPAGLVNGASAVNPGLINGAACAAGCTAQANGGGTNIDRIASIDLSSGVDGTLFNFGEVQNTFISGLVWLDGNRDGVLDNSETTRLAGVTLRLVQGADCTSGTTLQTAVSASDGSYRFDNVRAFQNYLVCETQPAGYGTGSANGTLGSNVITVSSLPTAGSPNNNFGETLGSIAGTVYVDYSPAAPANTNNGLRDSGETGIANVPITLSGNDITGKAVSLSTTTDSNGNYSFADLLQSDASGYTVTEGAIPVASGVYNDGKDTLGSIGGSNAVKNSLGAIGLGAGVQATGYNFGELPIAPISGTVYLDRDRNGSLGSGDGSIAGVVVRLVLGSNCSGTEVARTSTDSNGNYVFSGASAGLSYTLCETQPTGYADGSTNAGSATGSSSISNAITVPNLPLAGASSNNFGERAGSLSGSVWLDSNNDGVRQAGENGIAGVTVTLSGTDASGAVISRSTTTDANGNYSFSDLLAAGAAGYTVTEQSAQPVVNGVTTLNGRSVAGSTGGSATAVGSTPSVISAIPLSPGADSSNNRFGEVLPVSLSGTVFLDLNNNGLQNLPGDAGLPGVALVISGTDDTGATVSRNITTASDGSYAVADLRPGTYSVTEPTQPAGTSNGITTAGSAGGTATGVGTLPSAITGIALATSGATSTGNNFAEIPNNSVINGTVWLDSNNNGLIDNGEAGIAGVTVELSGTDTAGRTVARSTTTDANGRYSFDTLAPGTYKLNEPTQPAGTVNGITVPGSSGGTATAVNTTPSAISGIPLGVGSTSSAHNFGELPSAEVSGRVYADNNNNGAVDPNEAGLPGVTIVLTGTDDQGNAVTLSTVTAADGSYSFGNLRPGTYTLTEPTQPAGTVNGQTTPGSAGGSATAPSVAVSAISGIVLTPGAKSTGNLFGELANSPDLRVSKAAIEARFTVGFAGHYTVSVRNVGEITSSGTYTVSDHLPSGLTLAVTPTGTGWTCTGAAGASSFSCTSSSAIAAGTTSAATLSVTVNVAAAAAAAGSVNNAVLVDGGGEIDARRPSAAELDAFNNNPAGLPLCAAAITQNACRAATPVQLASALSGTVWYDIGSSPRILDSGDRRLPGWGVEIVDVGTGAIVGRATTAADGSYKVTGLMPGIPLAVRFRDPASGIVFGYPVNGEKSPGSSGAVCDATAAANGKASSCVGSGDTPALTVILAPGQELPQQSMPVDPSGVVYDSGVRTPVPGSVVTLAPVGVCTGWNPATGLVGASLGGYAISGGSASMTVGPDGFYQFLFGPGAPASCTFGLTVTPPAGYAFTSTAIPPAAGPLLPAGGAGSVYAVQPQAAPPVGAVGSGTKYFLTLTTGSGGANVIHNHIPIDPALPTGLAIAKTGDKAIAEVGDTVRYTLTVTVITGAVPRQTTIVDRLPPGFTYIKGTAMVGDLPIADPQGNIGPVLAFNLGPMPASKQLVLRYRVRVGVGAQQGDGVNRARAYACGVPAGCVDAGFNPLGGAVATGEAAYRVKVSGGVFATEACVAGKVFVDCNNNHVQDAEELGIPGVRLVMSDGTTLISDSEGKYSVCGVAPRSTVIKVDGLTLPRGSRLTTSSNRNLGDANSLWLDLKNGELHRADFIEGSCSNTVLEQVKARRAQGEVRAPEPEKQGGPALRFDSKSAGKTTQTSPQQGTDGANQQAPKARATQPVPKAPADDETNVPTPALPMNRPPPPARDSGTPADADGGARGNR